MSQVLDKFECRQKIYLSRAEQVLHGSFFRYGKYRSSPIMRRMAEGALSQVMGAKRKFGRSFGLGDHDDSGFVCMVIIAYLVSLR
jgi:hypothetical protein